MKKNAITDGKQARAAKGGEMGVNGEFYEGGKFLPTTDRPKQKPPLKSGKALIAPYVWAPRPDGWTLSIWERIEHKVRFVKGNYQYIKGQGLVGLQVEVVREVVTLSSYGFQPWDDDYEAYYQHLLALAARFNAGERWIRAEDDPYYYATIEKNGTPWKLAKARREADEAAEQARLDAMIEAKE